jgi:roadblock/LC7 domain-containing protein
MSILKKLESLSEMAGYMGAGVFAPDGRMLGGVTEIEGMNFEIAGSLFHDSYLITDNLSQEAGFGKVDMFQLNTEKGTVFGKCYKQDGKHFHVLMVMKAGANIAMANLKLKKVIDELVDEI